MKHLVFLGIILFGLSSCHNTGDISLKFQPMIADQVLVSTEKYQVGPLNLRFENLTFLITDIMLVNDDNESVELSEAEFLSLNFYDEATAKEGAVIKYDNIKTGTYNKLRFTVGVSEALNKTSPSDYTLGEALARSDHYWEHWGSYIFSKIEGSADLEGEDTYTHKFFYHTGSDALARTFEIDQNIVISKDSETSLELSIDYNEIMKDGNGGYMDVEAYPKNHNIEDLDIITQIVDNYQNAIKVRS